jgi:hypothetical protein
VQFEVEPAGVADRLPLVVSAPESGCGGVAVGALEACATVSRLKRVLARIRVM